jgi:hypothetical protein
LFVIGLLLPFLGLITILVREPNRDAIESRLIALGQWKEVGSEATRWRYYTAEQPVRRGG